MIYNIEFMSVYKDNYQNLKIINNIEFQPREIDIIACIIGGKTNEQEIADLISIHGKIVTLRMVQNDKSKIRQKIRCHDIAKFFAESDEYLTIREHYLNVFFRYILIQISNKKSISYDLYLVGDIDQKTLPRDNHQIDIIEYLALAGFIRRESNIQDIFGEKNNDTGYRTVPNTHCGLIILANTPPNNVQNDITNPIIRLVKSLKDRQTEIVVLVDCPAKSDLVGFSTRQSNPDISTISDVRSTTEIIYHFMQSGVGLDEQAIFSASRFKNHFYIEFFALIQNFKKLSDPSVRSLIASFNTDYNRYVYLLQKNYSFNVTGAVAIISILLFLAFGFLVIYSFFLKFPLDLYSTSENQVTSWDLPKQHNAFVGRENLLKELEDKLNNADTTISKKIAISACTGLGGIGKTQLALHYAHHSKNPYTLKAWFNSENISSLHNKYYEFALAHGYDEKTNSEINAIDYVKKWFSEHPGWLIVYDNVNEYKEIEPFMPDHGGEIIITTRQRSWPNNFSIVSIDVMSEEESLKTIGSLSGRNLDKEIDESKELAKTLGYLPLALAQASAYIKNNNISINEYLSLYKTHELELLSDITFPEGLKHNPVAVTWNISLVAIVKETLSNKEPPIAIELITICSFLSPDKISKELLLQWLKKTYPSLSSHQITLNRHVSLLWRYSMINYTGNNNIAIHRLVQVVLRNQLEQALEGNNKICDSLDIKWFELLLDFFIENESEFKLNNSFEQLIATGDLFKSKFKNHYSEQLAELDLVIAPVYFNQEKYEEYLKVIDKAMKYLNEKNISDALKCKALYLYSAYYRKKGNFTEAENKINEALSIINNKKALGFASDKELKGIKGKILFNKANIIYAKSKKLGADKLNKTEVKNSITLAQDSINIFNEINDTRDRLRSLELQGRLLLIDNKPKDVVRNFNKYLSEIEEVADDRTKMFFYMTYSDAYFSDNDNRNSLLYSNKAKSIAVRLNLKNEIKNIVSKQARIDYLINKSNYQK